MGNDLKELEKIFHQIDKDFAVTKLELFGVFIELME